MNIGFIGLGTMGSSMAANLQKSQHRLVVNDVRKESAEAYIGAGAEWADTPRQIAEQCDVVFTSLRGRRRLRRWCSARTGCSRAPIPAWPTSTFPPTPRR